MKQLFYILTLFIAISCDIMNKEKPSNVPIGAIWKGGCDGGCWIYFKSITQNSIDALIFYENGEVWVSGVFKKIGNCKINNHNIKEEITAFDGQRLLTKNNCSFKK